MSRLIVPIGVAWGAWAVAALMLVGGCANAPAVERQAEVKRFQDYLTTQRQQLKIDPTTPLSTKQCEELALANSLALRVRQLSLRLQDEEVRLALAGGLPKASLAYTNTQRNNKALSQGEPGQAPIEMSDRHQQNLAVQAIMPVLDFGLTYYSYQIALDRRRQERLLLTRAEQLLRRDVRVAYARHAGAIRQERMSDTANQAAQAVLRVAKNLEREQMTAPADTALVEAALAEATLQLSLARQSVQQTKLSLSQLMSLGPGIDFRIDESLPALPPAPTAQLVQRYEEQALLARPELAVQDLERHASANAVKRDASEFFPRIDATAGYNWSNSSQLVNPSFFLYGIQVTHSLLDGGATIFRYQRAKKTADVESARTLLLSLGILYDVDLRALQVRQAQETVHAAAALEKARRAAFERIISLYKEGLEDEAGAARSLADLTIQATALDRAQTDYQVAWHELEAAVLPESSATSQPTTQAAATEPATAEAATTKASEP